MRTNEVVAIKKMSYSGKQSNEVRHDWLYLYNSWDLDHKDFHPVQEVVNVESFTINSLCLCSWSGHNVKHGLFSSSLAWFTNIEDEETGLGLGNLENQEVFTQQQTIVVKREPSFFAWLLYNSDLKSP